MSLIILLSAGLFASSSDVPVTPIQVPTGTALTQSVTEASETLFSLWFERCDAALLRRMTASDREFYHDKAGASFGAELDLAQNAETCPPGHTGRPRIDLRRELVAGSRRVHPVPGFGATEEGEHVFFRRASDGSEQRLGQTKFLQLWKMTPEGWVLSRAFNYTSGGSAP